MKPTLILIALFAVVTLGNAGVLDTVKDKYNEAKTALQDIADRVKKGESPIQIVQQAIAAHPDLVDKLDVFHKLCPTAQAPVVNQRGVVTDYVKTGCAFITKNYPILKAQIAEYEKDVRAWYEKYFKGKQ